MLYQMFQQNPSNFTLFLEYKNPQIWFFIFDFMHAILFSPNEYTQVYVITGPMMGVTVWQLT